MLFPIDGATHAAANGRFGRKKFAWERLHATEERVAGSKNTRLSRSSRKLLAGLTDLQRL